MSEDDALPPEQATGERPLPAHPKPKDPKSQTPVSLKYFFENTRPGTSAIVAGGLIQRENFLAYKFADLELDLHCDIAKCGGVRGFRKITTDEFIREGEYSHSVHTRFICKNCEIRVKLYSLLVRYEHGVCTISKLAEVPDWGPPTPSRIYRLIEADRDLYLKGRRCENQGLGIAAFAYYRRVVVNQKNTILDELIKACGKLGADRLLIVELEGAKDDGRFKESFAKVKHALPESLMINGHNPITLLHNALSEGIHENDDQECLERAEAIRVVLTEMAERIGNALKEQREVEAAVTKLMATQPARERP